MPNEVDTDGGGRTRYDETPKGGDNMTMTSSSSESEVDIARILDPFEQLERECNGEVAAVGEQKLVKSDSDEGVVADDEGGDVVVLDGYVVCFIEWEF